MPGWIAITGEPGKDTTEGFGGSEEGEGLVPEG